MTYEYDHEELYDEDENGDDDHDSPNGILITAHHKESGEYVGHLHIHQDDIGRSHYDIGDIHVHEKHRKSNLSNGTEPPSVGMVRHANKVLDAVPSGHASSGFTPNGRNFMNRLKKNQPNLFKNKLGEAKELANSIALNEMFDSPYKTSFDPRQTEYLKKQAKDKNLQVTNIQCHKIENDMGYILTHHSNGSTEIHHFDKDGKSGEITKRHMNDPRWVGTMYHHIMNHCLNGNKSCRIMAPYDPENKKSLHNHYKRIVGMIAKKHDLDVVHGVDTVEEKKMAVITVQPRNKFTAVTGLVFKK